MTSLQARPLMTNLEDAVLASKQDQRATIQKLIHQHPDNAWLVAILSHVLADSCPTLAQAYKALTGKTGTVLGICGSGCLSMGCGCECLWYVVYRMVYRALVYDTMSFSNYAQFNICWTLWTEPITTGKSKRGNERCSLSCSTGRMPSIETGSHVLWCLHAYCRVNGYYDPCVWFCCMFYVSIFAYLSNSFLWIS